jgi:hypothetical protein
MSRLCPGRPRGAALNGQLRIWNRILRLVLDPRARFSDTAAGRHEFFDVKTR